MTSVDPRSKIIVNYRAFTERKRVLHLKIGSIVIDCNEFDQMLEFWQGSLHYLPKHPAKDGWVISGS